MAKRKKIELIGKKRGSITRRYKIVIDARNIHRSTGRYNRGLLNYLPEFDSVNEYHILINPEDQGTWKPTSQNFHLHVVPFKHYSFSEQLGFARYLYKLKPDLVHFLMPQQPLLYFGPRVTSILDLTLVRFKNIDKNKYIYALEQRIFSFLLKNVARRSKQIITISNYVKNDITQYTKIQKSKITVTYPAAEELATNSVCENATLTDKKFILFVGNAFPHKNLERLTDAFAELQKNNPEYHLVFAGKKDFFYDQLEKHTQEHAYTNIHILGFVPDDELMWLYQNAQCYVFPSLSEGFGLPGLEAMVYNLPVASSNATCLPEIYGDAALYFDPNSTSDIAKVLDKLINNTKLRTKLVKNGQKRLKEFSWRTMAQQTYDVYIKALKK